MIAAPMIVQLATALAVAQPAPSCPPRPEPPILASAALDVPASGDTLLLSAAPSFRRDRFALRVTRPPDRDTSRFILVRLERRLDCNLHDRTGEWTFDLGPQETRRLFASAAAVEQDRGGGEIVLDGTSIEVRLFSSGVARFAYSSNGPETFGLSELVLAILRRHVPHEALPPCGDWSCRVPAARPGDMPSPR